MVSCWIMAGIGKGEVWARGFAWTGKNHEFLAFLILEGKSKNLQKKLKFAEKVKFCTKRKIFKKNLDQHPIFVDQN